VDKLAGTILVCSALGMPSSRRQPMPIISPLCGRESDFGILASAAKLKCQKSQERGYDLRSKSPLLDFLRVSCANTKKILSPPQEGRLAFINSCHQPANSARAYTTPTVHPAQSARDPALAFRLDRSGRSGRGPSSHRSTGHNGRSTRRHIPNRLAGDGRNCRRSRTGSIDRIAQVLFPGGVRAFSATGRASCASICPDSSANDRVQAASTSWFQAAASAVFFSIWFRQSTTASKVSIVELWRAL
jgi:hypothetical protein